MQPCCTLIHLQELNFGKGVVLPTGGKLVFAKGGGSRIVHAELMFARNIDKEMETLFPKMACIGMELGKLWRVCVFIHHEIACDDC